MLNALSLRDSLPTLAAFAAVYVIWGSTYLAIAFAIESIPPFVALGTRFGAAGLVLYAWMRLRGHANPRRRELINAAFVGALTAGVGTGTVAWAEQHLATGVVALLVSFVPIWMVLLDWKWLGGGAPSRQVIAGLVLGIAGIIVLVGPEMRAGGIDTDVIAIGLVLLGSMSWSIGSLQGKRVRMPSNPFISSAIQMVGGALLLIVTGVLTGETRTLDLARVSMSSAVGWSYLVVFGSVIAFSAYVWLMNNASPKQVSSYAYVNPIVAVFLGWLLADEVVDAVMVVAVALLISAVVLVVRYGKSVPGKVGSPGRMHGASVRIRRFVPVKRRVAPVRRALKGEADPCLENHAA